MADQHEILPSPNVVDIDAADVLASLTQFARSFGVHVETLRRLVVEHGVESAGRRHGHALYRLRDVYAALTAGNAAVIDPDKLSPFQRRAWYQSENERMRLERERGRLLDHDDVGRSMARLMQMFVRSVETSVDVLERDAG